MKSQNEKITPKQTVEIVREFSQEALDAILKIDRECFPEEWRYPDADEYYADSLRSKADVNIFLREKEDVIGYIHATPLNDVQEEMTEYDPEFKKDAAIYYLEMIGILSEYRGRGGAKKLILEMCEEINRKGFKKISAHARKMNGFNNLIKKLFKENISRVRNLESWHYGGGEPYEYIEWIYKK